MIKNTGYKGYARLRQKRIDTGEYTGVTKVNDPSDPDYIQPVYDPKYCEVGDLYINVNTNTVNVDSGTNGINISVTSNTTWTITTSSPYVTMPFGTEGIHDDSAVVSIAENTGDARQLTFNIVSDIGDVSQTITVYQEGVVQLNSVSVAKSSSSSTACSTYDSGFRYIKYIDTLDFEAATILCNNIGGTEDASAGYYSDGLIWRYWTGTVFNNTGICKPSIN